MPSAAIILGTAATPIQPSSTYSSATSRSGASIQASLSMIPATAPAQTAIRMALASAPCSAISANGVYVPAITTKIIEWSKRRIHRRAPGERHPTR
jgi:hypothetical protein